MKRISKRIINYGKNVPNVLCSSKKLRIPITWSANANINSASCAYKIGHQLITYAREHTKRCFFLIKTNQ